MPDEPIITLPPEDAPPEAPPGYHAAIGRIGARRQTAAQKAASLKNITRANEARAKLTHEQRAAMLAEYAAGASVAVLAERYGITPAHIYSTASRAGHTGRKRAPNVPDSVKQDAARAYLAGSGSIAKIGKQYGIWPATLRVWIARERRAAEVAESEGRDE